MKKTTEQFTRAHEVETFVAAEKGNFISTTYYVLDNEVGFWRRCHKNPKNPDAKLPGVRTVFFSGGFIDVAPDAAMVKEFAEIMKVCGAADIGGADKVQWVADTLQQAIVQGAVKTIGEYVPEPPVKTPPTLPLIPTDHVEKEAVIQNNVTDPPEPEKTYSEKVVEWIDKQVMNDATKGVTQPPASEGEAKPADQKQRMEWDEEAGDWVYKPL